jgi:L-lactate dehydrogenase
MAEVELPVRDSRIAVIGCGYVGTTCASALLQSHLVRELMLLDFDAARAEGEALDMQHAVPLGTPVRVFTGGYKEAAASDIVIIAAGVGGPPEQSRLELLGKNVAIIRQCVASLMAEGFAGILLIAANPVDVLARVAQLESGLPACKVIGSGTVIDTARLRGLVGEGLGIDARFVHAVVLGEHGDSSVAAWSMAHVGGIPLDQYPGADRLPARHDLLQQVHNAAARVVALKGNTRFAIAGCVLRICEAVVRNERSLLPVSTLMQGQYGLRGTYLSTGCILGAGGVEASLELPLDAAELQGLRASAAILDEAFATVAPAT